jgi:rfaE bifunctional protein kinase chain/domain
MKILFKQELFQAIKNFRRKKILVVGDVMLDLYIQGPPRSVSQEAPVVVVTAQKKYFKLGGAANAAENIKSLGGIVHLAGVIGDHNKHDDFGRSFLQTIRQSTIARQGLFFDHTRPTTLKMRIISQGQQLVRVDEESTKKIDKTLEKKILNYIRPIIPKVDAVFISDYNKGVITSGLMKKIMSESKKYSIKVIVDPKPQNHELYRGVDYMTPNEIELTKMSGRYDVDESKILTLAKQIKNRLDIANLVVTRGSRGMDLLDKSGKIWHIPTFAKKVVDVSGAGDTVAAIIALGASDLSPNKLSYLAALGASISVEKLGTSIVTPSELMTLIQS